MADTNTLRATLAQPEPAPTPAAQVQPDDTNKLSEERTRYERAMYGKVDSFARRNGSYISSEAERGWEAWLAAKAATPPVALPAVVDAEAVALHAFKNFHRLLCERFGYCHDEKDWRRDQLSLIEFVAAKLEAIPVAWMYEHDGCLDEPILTMSRWPECREPWSETPLDALALAKHAIEKVWIDAVGTGHGEHSISEAARRRIEFAAAGLKLSVTHLAPASASEPYPDHNVKRPTAEPVVLSMKRSERESLSPEAFMALQHSAEKMAQVAKADEEYRRSQGAGRERLANTVCASASASGASTEVQAPIPQASGEVRTLVGYMSPEQVPLVRDAEGEAGTYIPMRATPAGLFTMPLYTPPAPPASGSTATPAPEARKPLGDEAIKRALDAAKVPDSEDDAYDFLVWRACEQFYGIASPSGAEGGERGNG